MRAICQGRRMTTQPALRFVGLGCRFLSQLWDLDSGTTTACKQLSCPFNLGPSKHPNQGPETLEGQRNANQHPGNSTHFSQPNVQDTSQQVPSSATVCLCVVPISCLTFVWGGVNNASKNTTHFLRSLLTGNSPSECA